MKRLLLLIVILMYGCSAQPRAMQMQATQALGTVTPMNTPYSLLTDWYTPIKTPVPTCAVCMYIPLGTLTFTPAPVATVTPIVYSYVTTKVANIYNNNGYVMERWEAGRVFQTGDWVKNGRLYSAPVCLTAGLT